MKRRRPALLCLLGLALLLCPLARLEAADAPAPATAALPRAVTETPAARDARMKWWREARFGMFIHWGMYAVLGGKYKGEEIAPKHGAEWIMCDALLARADYEPFAKEFNPLKFNADEWVRTAADAGMKYMVITSKHHDGFSMFDTKQTDYSIVRATPYGKDPMKDLAAACKRAGLRFGFYYSQLDWHHPALANNPDKKGQSAFRFNLALDKAKYVAYMKAQLRELITQYDPAVLFFDGQWVDWWTQQDGRDLEAYCRGLKPDLIINNRVGKSKPEDGDYGTPEQKIPATGLGYDWETCMTLNDNWGYRESDRNWKSAEDLIRKLVDISSKGGNFLLNVGPTAEGVIPQPSVERLRQMGQWLRVNGEAVYATQPSPCEQPKWGRFTRKAGRVYAHVFDWPAGGSLEISAKAGKVAKAYLLTDAAHAPLGVEATAAGTVVTLPAKAPDAIDSVVVLEVRE